MDATEMPIKINSDPTSGYASVGAASASGTATVVSPQDKTETVMAVLVVSGISHYKLKDEEIASLAEATKQAAVSFATITAANVVSLPLAGKTDTTTILEVEFFVTASQREELLPKLQVNDAKPFETTLQNSIRELNLEGAKPHPGGSVYVYIEKITSAKGILVTYSKVITTLEPVPVTTTTKKVTTPRPQETMKVTTTTMAPAPTKKVTTVLTFNVMSFDKVNENTYVRMKLVEDIKQSVLEQLPTGYTEEHIHITLRKGSVKAEVEITPLDDSDSAAASLVQTLQAKKDDLRATVTTKVKAMPEVLSVLEDEARLADLTVIATDPAEVVVTIKTTVAPDSIQGLIADFSIRVTVPSLVLALTIFLQAAQML